jgi:hypothetical protein
LITWADDGKPGEESARADTTTDPAAAATHAAIITRPNLLDLSDEASVLSWRIKAMLLGAT